MKRHDVQDVKEIFLNEKVYTGWRIENSRHYGRRECRQLLLQS